MGTEYQRPLTKGIVRRLRLAIENHDTLSANERSICHSLAIRRKLQGSIEDSIIPRSLFGIIYDTLFAIVIDHIHHMAAIAACDSLLEALMEFPQVLFDDLICARLRWIGFG
ncbi:MAG: hypothetical protein NTX17_00855 [Candidatus Eisenbacteria bacterium]|nr:hypothetical protein [Candidatus Eisenbacteria bacterium]